MPLRGNPNAHFSADEAVAYYYCYNLDIIFIFILYFLLLSIIPYLVYLYFLVILRCLKGFSGQLCFTCFPNSSIFAIFVFSLTSLCKARFKIYQKVSLITPATKSFGKLSNWTSSQIKQMCSLVEALTPEQLLELSAKEVCYWMCF